jgi:hypothetical protein
MDVLLDLEPRDITADLIEPTIAFAESFAAPRLDRERCFFLTSTRLPTYGVCD